MIPALIGGAGSVIGGLIGGKGVTDQNKANRQEAQKNRDFQERMSNTAHQRNIKDLEKAGLNPILSATQGGASSPSGAQAQMQSELEPMANSAKDTAMMASQVKLLNAQANKTQAEANIMAPKSTLMKTANEIVERVIPTVHSAKSNLNQLGSKAGLALYDILNPEPTTVVHKPPKRDKPIQEKKPIQSKQIRTGSTWSRVKREQAARRKKYLQGQ